MKTIKFTEAKTQTLKQAINLIDMFKVGSSLKSIKEQASFAGLEIKGRTFKAIYPQLVAFYENALKAEETEALAIINDPATSIESSEVVKKTAEEKIEAEVGKIGGTWVKKRNARNKLIAEHNKNIQKKIDHVSKKIRHLISKPEQEKRSLYALKSQLTRQLIG